MFCKKTVICTEEFITLSLLANEWKERFRDVLSLNISTNLYILFNLLFTHFLRREYTLFHIAWDGLRDSLSNKITPESVSLVMQQAQEKG